ncbi:MAG: hypothetical protein QNJ32_14135 [Xenococcaceae cyanobacterium MO_167.B27]|nr:hypothetical protein [Xenococcaceae cyanobacterium MO_167.B27]
MPKFVSGILSTSPISGESKQLCPLKPLSIVTFSSTFAKGIKYYPKKPKLVAKDEL